LTTISTISNRLTTHASLADRTVFKNVVKFDVSARSRALFAPAWAVSVNDHLEIRNPAYLPLSGISNLRQQTG